MEMTIRDALAHGTRTLRAHTCVGSDADREPADLLAAAARTTRDDLYARLDDTLVRPIVAVFTDLVERRLDHAPMGHLIGTTPFLGRDYAVTKDVLIPRPATEIIAEDAIETFRSSASPLAIDVGTGSGCIATSLAAARSDSRVIAIDVSENALNIARKNATVHGVAERIDFLIGDLVALAAADITDASHVTIVANLPYIPAAMIDKLDDDVRLHEPRIALDGGPDGLDLYRRLFDQLAVLPRRVPFDLFVEILPEQYDPMYSAVGEHFPDAVVAPIRSGSEGAIIGAKITKR